MHPPEFRRPTAPFLLFAAAIVAGFLAASEVGAQLFPDPQLEAAVRRQVFAKRDGREPLVEADVVNVSTVEARHLGIRRLDGLEKCRNLAMLDLGGNEIVDLAPLAGLRRLQFLDVQGNRITNLGPISSNTPLQYLQLARNSVASLEPLSSLTNLSALYLSGNRISDIGPLLHLRRLVSLYLDENRIRSVEGIASLKGLVSLSLSGNRIADLRPVTSLTGLQHLFAERNRLQNLDPVVSWLGSDAGREFAPFLHLYLANNPLSSEARRHQLEVLRKLGARIHDAPGSVGTASSPTH